MATPYRWPDKDPSDIWPYGIDFSGWCEVAGEIADSLVIAVAPAGLVIGSWTVTAEGRAAVELSEGTAGVDYTVTVQLVTVSGRKLERSVMLKVRDQ